MGIRQFTSGSCALPALIWLGAAPASAADESSSRPQVMFNRWEEDWSPLADPALRTGPFDMLKYISLGTSGAYLSIGGGLRERLESNDSTAFGVMGARSDTYAISRGELHADLRDGPWQLFLQLQSDFALGKKVKVPVDSDKLDLEQGFVAYVQPLPDGALKFRIGRQQYAFDLQRFVAVRDGPNVRQSFDAIWADYERGPWRLIAYYTRPVAVRDAHAFDDKSSSGMLFYGLRIERHVLGVNELSAYWSRFTNDHATYLSARGRERRNVWDVRFAGARDRLDWDLEAMGQTGHVADQSVRAWAVGSRLGYTFSGSSLKPRLGLQVDLASGDRKASDHTLGTFNPLFPNGNYLTLAGYTGYVNFIHVKPSLTIKPGPGLSVLLAAAAQWRMTTADAVYAQPNIPIPHTAQTGTRWTGAYGQIRCDWSINSYLTAAVEAVHFDAGRTIIQAGGHDSNYIGTELKFAW